MMHHPPTHKHSLFHRNLYDIRPPILLHPHFPPLHILSISQLKTAKASAGAGAGETAELKAKLAEAEATLSASDVQALLSVRKSALQGAAVVGEYSSVALDKASKGMADASDAYEVS